MKKQKKYRIVVHSFKKDREMGLRDLFSFGKNRKAYNSEALHAVHDLYAFRIIINVAQNNSISSPSDHLNAWKLVTAAATEILTEDALIIASSQPSNGNMLTKENLTINQNLLHEAARSIHTIIKPDSGEEIDFLRCMTVFPFALTEFAKKVNNWNRNGLYPADATMIVRKQFDIMSTL